VGHLPDTERVFAYRALRIGRGDPTPLPGYDDQAYVPEQRAVDRPPADLARSVTPGEFGELVPALFASPPHIVSTARNCAFPLIIRA
jgi:hypothetical protein